MSSTTWPTAAHPPLVVAGMHRSGTSLAASLVAGAGVDVGRRLMGASRGNERGHYEDLDFYEFHARVLRAHGAGTEGFACIERLSVPESLRRVAESLVEARSRLGSAWGWKDPRTCLFLDFWGELLPEARFLFVFRSPWEVMDSLFRRGDEIFAANPAHAARVWLDYNRRIVEFLRRHRPRCLLVEVGQLAADPAGVFAAIRSRLVLPVGEPPERFEQDLLVRDDSHARAGLVECFLPEAVSLYDEMRALAGMPRRVGSRRAGGDAVLAEQAIGEWARASAAGTRLKQLEAERDAAVAAKREAEAAVAAAAATAEERVASLERRLSAAEGRARELTAVRAELSEQVQRAILGHLERSEIDDLADSPLA